jgi:hypothetical protein
MTTLNQGQTNRRYSYLLGPVDKSARYAQRLCELLPSLSEWGIHPGLNNAKLIAIESDSRHIRQTDFDFLMSQEAQDIVKQEGIILLDYRALQLAWRGK